MTNIHLIGGEKGGVGKSLVARLLAQYFIDKGIPFLGFDTDRSHSTLLRFYQEFAAPLATDKFESLDGVVETAVANPGHRILVDLAAQTHAPLVKWMEESGVLDSLQELGLTVAYWHVMDSGRDSVELLKPLLDRFGSRLNYVIVLNQSRGETFDIFEKSEVKTKAEELGAKIITLRKLYEPVMTKIDALNSSFWAAQNRPATEANGLGLLERQRVRVWMRHCYDQIEKVGV